MYELDEILLKDNYIGFTFDELKELTKKTNKELKNSINLGIENNKIESYLLNDKDYYFRLVPLLEDITIPDDGSFAFLNNPDPFYVNKYCKGF